jgi:signal transduction histidine kinase
MRWMNRDVPNLAKVKELTGRIAESGRHASDIVKRIRAMAARQALEPALLDLGEVVAEALHFVRHDFETRSIGLSLDIAGDLPRVMGDRVQLQQVIVNLLINAQQAPTPNGENRLIEIGMRRTEPRTVTISVEDNGAGIAQADLGRLFDSFFTTKHDGVGIGLAICQSIIAAHGGTISVRNRSQGGAAFSFTLPIAAQQ